MKKRVLSLLLALALAVSILVIPAEAGFSDVSDPNTLTAIETLRMMGVLDGYSDGTFRPAGQLTRAQFCKMAAYAMDGEGELGKYRTVTIFPDVKPSHWAAAHINMAAKGKGIIAGYPDGKFHPDRTVTAGHAVTILLRLLGYTDEEVGGVWPDSYMAVGESIGLTDGVTTNGNTPLSRAQAAKLFLNLLDTEKKGGGTLYALSEETMLLSVDGGSGTMKTADGKSYQMAHPVASSALTGAKGYVVLNKDGKALTFLPVTNGTGGAAAGAVVVAEDRSAAGFAELAGNSNYSIYKNGIQIGMGGLRRNDVATFYPATNAIRVSDTRVTVYYEACTPSPDAATSITVLGGTEFHVLPAARASLAKFKPGKMMTLLLTADGQVASAVEASGSAARGNAMGVVSADGAIDLLCGTERIRLGAAAEEKYYGQVVNLSASEKGTLNLTVPSGGVSGDLNVDSRTVGSRKLAENAMIFDGGEQIALASITSGVVRDEQVTYARTNWNGDVDLVVLNGGNGDGVIYGRAKVSKAEDTQNPIVDANGKEPYAEGWIPTYETIAGDTTLTVEYGKGKSVSQVSGYDAHTGDYVTVTVRNERFVNFAKLTELSNVSAQSWTGTTSVLYGGRSYPVAADVLCYNADSGDWVTLEQAKAYSNTMDLYVHNGVVRIVEVRH